MQLTNEIREAIKTDITEFSKRSHNIVRAIVNIYDDCRDSPQLYAYTTDQFLTYINEQLNN